MIDTSGPAAPPGATTPVAVTCTFDSADHGKGLAISEYTDAAVALAPYLNTGEPVAGLGEAAAWVPDGTLYVRKGNRGFGLHASGFDVADPASSKTLQQALTQLATLVLQKF